MVIQSSAESKHTNSYYIDFLKCYNQIELQTYKHVSKSFEWTAAVTSNFMKNGFNPG